MARLVWVYEPFRLPHVCLNVGAFKVSDLEKIKRDIQGQLNNLFDGFDGAGVVRLYLGKDEKGFYVFCTWQKGLILVDAKKKIYVDIPVYDCWELEKEFLSKTKVGKQIVREVEIPKKVTRFEKSIKKVKPIEKEVPEIVKREIKKEVDMTKTFEDLLNLILKWFRNLWKAIGGGNA